MSSRFLEFQVLEIAEKRKRARAIASLAMGAAIYLIIVVVTILLSRFISFQEQILVLALGAVAGALISLAYYMLETYPSLPGSFTVYGEVRGDASQLTGLDAAIASEFTRNGAIEVGDFARRYGVDKSVVVARIIELEKAGIIRVNGVEAS